MFLRIKEAQKFTLEAVLQWVGQKLNGVIFLETAFGGLCIS
jgi:hypothetical protein